MAKSKQQPQLPMPEPDGKKAYLPHPFFQSCIFAATRQPQCNKIERINRFGDKLMIQSMIPLRARPHMGVFLAAIALFQKHCRRPDPSLLPTDALGLWGAQFPIGDLYDLTGMSRGKSRSDLLDALYNIGTTRISLDYADSDKHGGTEKVRFDGLWTSKVVTKRGRAGSTVSLYPIDAIVPQNYYLWADASICNKIQSDTARSLFWSLICRESLRGSSEEFQKLCGSTDRLWQWQSRSFLPALDELAKYNYRINFAEGDETVTIKRPATMKEIKNEVRLAELMEKYEKIQKSKAP